VDHGIEAPDARQDKPLEGHVQLKISERDDAWVLEMNDDGRGIDTDKLTARAVASGRVNQSEVASLTEQDRLSLIFLDGLSSADVTTDVSGRGVGMSAVWDAVREAEGQIEVTSELGRGTRFLITVPKPPELVPAGEAPQPFVGRQAAR
jgi:two-component system chemotaxis sensor kinase CheA